MNYNHIRQSIKKFKNPDDKIEQTKNLNYSFLDILSYPVNVFKKYYTFGKTYYRGNPDDINSKDKEEYENFSRRSRDMRNTVLLIENPEEFREKNKKAIRDRYLNAER